MGSLTIKTIPHGDQRYNTVGDYQTDENGNRTILISDLGDPRMEFLVALHEMVEAELCRQAGITDEEIDAFDFAFAEERAAGDACEPGDDPLAPYHVQHMYATEVEKRTCAQMGMGWSQYNQRIADVMSTYKQKS